MPALPRRRLTWALLRYPRLRPVAVGVPTVLIEDGRRVDAGLRREGMTPEEVGVGRREHGGDGVGDVRRATLDLDGGISLATARIQQDVHPKRQAVCVRHRGSRYQA